VNVKVVKIQKNSIQMIQILKRWTSVQNHMIHCPWWILFIHYSPSGGYILSGNW